MGSTEGECKRLHAGIEEFDGEGPVAHVARLADELVQALFAHDALPSRRRPCRCPFQAPRRRASRESAWACRSPRARARDAGRARGTGRRCVRLPSRVAHPRDPRSRGPRAPMVTPPGAGRRVVLRLVARESAGRAEIAGALVADVGFRRRVFSKSAALCTPRRRRRRAAAAGPVARRPRAIVRIRRSDSSYSPSPKWWPRIRPWRR